MGKGPNAEIPVIVANSTIMEDGVKYKVCASGTSVCVVSSSPSNSSSGASSSTSSTNNGNDVGNDVGE